MHPRVDGAGVALKQGARLCRRELARRVGVVAPDERVSVLQEREGCSSMQGGRAWKGVHAVDIAAPWQGACAHMDEKSQNTLHTLAGGACVWQNKCVILWWYDKYSHTTSVAVAGELLSRILAPHNMPHLQVCAAGLAGRLAGEEGGQRLLLNLIDGVPPGRAGSAGTLVNAQQLAV